MGGNAEEHPGNEAPRMASKEAVTWLRREHLSWLFLEGKKSVDSRKEGEHLFPPNHAIWTEHALDMQLNIFSWNIANATALMYMGCTGSEETCLEPHSLSPCAGPRHTWMLLQAFTSTCNAEKQEKPKVGVGCAHSPCDEAGLHWWITENWWSHRWENCWSPRLTQQAWCDLPQVWCST